MPASEESRIVVRPDLPADKGATYSISLDLSGTDGEPPRGEEVTIAMTLYRKLGKQRERVSTPGRARISSAIELLLNLLPGDAWEMDHQGEAETLIRIDWAKVPAGMRDPKLTGRKVI